MDAHDVHASHLLPLTHDVRQVVIAIYMRSRFLVHVINSHSEFLLDVMWVHLKARDHTSRLDAAA